MKILTRERLKPYSHVPGASCVIPGTHFILEAFPTLLRIGNLEIPIKGSVHGFTLQQDLEKNCVYVFGKSFHIQIAARPDGFTIDNQFFPVKLAYFIPDQWERLSLGIHKAQDWDLVLKRFELEEILPVLYGLGQKIPPVPPQPLTGTARLLKSDDFEALCRAAFHKILVPRLRDDQHQGLCPDEEGTGNPFFLIQEAYRKIRALVFRDWELLPGCPFEAGRMINIQTELGSFDLEWTKGFPNRAVFHASKSGELPLKLNTALSCYRVRMNDRERGRKQMASELLKIEAGKIYFLDRFQK